MKKEQIKNKEEQEATADKKEIDNSRALHKSLGKRHKAANAEKAKEEEE